MQCHFDALRSDVGSWQLADKVRSENPRESATVSVLVRVVRVQDNRLRLTTNAAIRRDHLRHESGMRDSCNPRA
jgi:hypothetical protein